MYVYIFKDKKDDFRTFFNLFIANNDIKFLPEDPTFFFFLVKDSIEE